MEVQGESNQLPKQCDWSQHYDHQDARRSDNWNRPVSRLISELYIEKTATNAATTSVHSYDHTRNTGNSVYEGLLDEATIDLLAGGGDDAAFTRVSKETRTCNLQGRLHTLTKDIYADGSLATRQRSSYQYDSKSIRFNQRVDDWNASAGEFDFNSETEFLVDHQNHTGYAQTQRETITYADGRAKTIDYTIGLDEIAQHTVAKSADGTITQDETLTFGHGSVRVTYTNTGGIQQVNSYSAYGIRISIHNPQGQPVSPDNIATAIAYAGKFFDAISELSYNHARFYNAVTAQWNRLDDFAGNAQDPQSFHKYAYVHSGTVNGTDPRGESLTLSLAIGSFIASGLSHWKAQRDISTGWFIASALLGFTSAVSFYRYFSASGFNIAPTASGKRITIIRGDLGQRARMAQMNWLLILLMKRQMRNIPQPSFPQRQISSMNKQLSML